MRGRLSAGDPLTFLDTLELEEFRLERKISSQQRDVILLRLKKEIEMFNPDRFIYPREEKTENILSKIHIIFLYSSSSIP